MLIDRIIYEKFFDKYFYIIIFLSYFFLIIIYRFLLPFGDEPDFHIRASSVVNGLQEWWTPIDFIRLSFLYDFLMTWFCPFKKKELKKTKRKSIHI